MAAKLVAFREKDRNFVAALIEAGLVEPDVIVARLSTVLARTHGHSRTRPRLAGRTALDSHGRLGPAGKAVQSGDSPTNGTLMPN